MKIIVKPFESRYREGVVDVLQYLWHEERNERLSHFDWEYFGNPCRSDPLAVIAVDENEEVMGFRGWVPGVVKVYGKEFLIARAADVVVSPRARRQGVFSKMTVYSLSYLKENGIQAILNLSSNSQSNPGYQKLGWVTMANMNIWYQLLFPSLQSSKKHIVEDCLQLKCNNHSVALYPYIPQGLKVPVSNDLSFSLEEGQLDWFAKRPHKNYLTLTANDVDGKLDALFIVEIEAKIAHLQFFYCNNISDVKYFKLLKPYIGKCVISAWGWALSEKNRLLLKQMGFLRIPLYEKIRKKPPILVRSIDDPENNNNWKIEGKDVRECNNWNINQIDDF